MPKKHAAPTAQLDALLEHVRLAQAIGRELGIKNILQPGLLKELVIAVHLGHKVISSKHDAEACYPSDPARLTRLATRLREAGKIVYGLGERKTPQSFIAACDRFIFTEVLRPAAVAETGRPAVVADLPDLRRLLTQAISEKARESGWASLAAVGSHVGQTVPSFDARNYGLSKLRELAKAQAYVEVQEAPDAAGAVHLNVRMREIGH